MNIRRSRPLTRIPALDTLILVPSKYRHTPILKLHGHAYLFIFWGNPSFPIPVVGPTYLLYMLRRNNTPKCR